MPSVAIIMPWVPNLSVNHHRNRRLGGGYYTRPEVRAWKDELTLLVRNQTHLRGLHPAPPVHISLRAFYPNLRAINDGDNMSKVINDAIEDAWIRPDGGSPLINDREFNFHSLGYEIDAEKPRLEITISWGGNTGSIQWFSR